MKLLKISVIIQLILFTIISCSKSITMTKKQLTDLKGQIKGKIIEFPNKNRLKTVEISFNSEKLSSYSLDSLGNFVVDNLGYGTYTIRIYNQESHYPILIKNVLLNSEPLDLGELPLFKEPYGYQAEWGELANENGDQFYHRHPIHDKGRDSLEMRYQSLFLTHFKNKKLSFESIDMSTDSTDNTINLWRFSLIKNK